jgi:phospholipid/cholesterol/gamma-HCH transport system permease protein
MPTFARFSTHPDKFLRSHQMQADRQKRFLVSKRVDGFFTIFSDVLSFVGRFFKELFRRPLEWNEFIRQCYEIGYRSLLLITMTSFITGVVFTKQSRPSLSEFGAQSWLPSLVAIAVIKSLAPLVTALICAGKVGSGIGAELGSMRVTEQIDAMEVSATNPFKYLVNTRIGAATLMLPMLMLYSAFVSMMGSYLDIYANEQTSFTTFVQNAFARITFLDYASSVIRSLVFGFTIGAVGCYKGFHTTGGTQGVGRAANAAVVVSMFFIFIEEMLILQIINTFR